MIFIQDIYLKNIIPNMIKMNIKQGELLYN